MKLTGTLLLLALGALPALPAVVSSGFVEITGQSPSGTFELGLADGSVAGVFSMGNFGPLQCSPCSPGDLIPISGTVVGNDFGSGSADIAGTPYPVLAWGNLNAQFGTSFAFTGAPVAVTGPGTFTSPFTFTGNLCGTAGGGAIPAPCAVHLPELTGAGTVTVTVAADAGGLLSYTSARYEFEAVPEPSSLMLTVPALLWVARRAYFRR